MSGSCVNEEQNRGTSAVSCAGESLGSVTAEFAPTPKWEFARMISPFLYYILRTKICHVEIHRVQDRCAAVAGRGGYDGNQMHRPVKAAETPKSVCRGLFRWFSNPSMTGLTATTSRCKHLPAR